MAMIAYKCEDIKVTVCDVNQARIDAWNSDELPVAAWYMWAYEIDQVLADLTDDLNGLTYDPECASLLKEALNEPWAERALNEFYHPGDACVM